MAAKAKTEAYIGLLKMAHEAIRRGKATDVIKKELPGLGKAYTMTDFVLMAETAGVITDQQRDVLMDILDPDRLADMDQQPFRVVLVNSKTGDREERSMTLAAEYGDWPTEADVFEALCLQPDHDGHKVILIERLY